eukprot:4360101-Heterocapsa_arctica.AAC.1
MAAPSNWQAKDGPGKLHGREQLSADLHTAPPGKPGEPPADQATPADPPQGEPEEAAIASPFLTDTKFAETFT